MQISKIDITIKPFIVSCCLFCIGNITVAAEQDNSAEAEKNSPQVFETITVTARKREESLQDTPIAISAFSGDSLEYRGVTNIGDIAPFTTNLSFQNNPSFGGASNSAAIYIRGIGQKEFLPTVDPGVGLYVDGVYVARSIGGIMDLIDVERVEVLKGPQGTLFGRNTIGGAINIITKKPSEESEGKISVTIGTDSRLDIKGSFDIPLSDTLFSKFTVASMSQDGYVIRDDGIDLGDDDSLAFRAAFRSIPTDDLEINFIIESNRDRENGPALTLMGVNHAGPIDPDTPPMATIHNVGANLAAGGGPIPCAIPPMPINLAVPGCYDNRYVNGNNRDSGTAPAFSNTDFWATNLNIDWTLSDDMSFQSITAFRDLDATFARDGDHSPFRVSQFEDFLDQKQFTQEFQLQGTAIDEKLNWILGIYYFKESGDNRNELAFTVSRFRSGGSFDNKSMALFSQGTYDVSEQLHFTFGVRYTDETKSFKPDQIIHENYFAGSGHPQLDAPFMQAGGRILPFLEKKVTYDQVDPYLNIAYDIDDDLMLYASYSEGYKSGGFSQRVFPPIIAPYTAPPGTADIDLIPSFLPEFVEVFELGFKFSGLDDSLRLNGAFFVTDYTDMQVQVFTGVAPITKNAGKAGIDGFELEMQYVPANGWFIEAGVGYLDAGYDEIDFTNTFVSVQNELERVSKWTANAAISKEFNLDGNGSIVTRFEWSYRSGFENDAFNTPQLRQSGYRLFNANVTWENSANDLAVILGVKNLTDEEFLHTGILGDAFQSYEGLYDRGRQAYLSLKYYYF